MQTEVQHIVNVLTCFTQQEDTMGPISLRVFELRIALARGNFPSVRGYGLRTYKPRQGRNAATVV